MKFNEKLNEYIEKFSCTAKELSGGSGLSAATLSRYRSGERVPEINSQAFEQLCVAIALIAEKKHIQGITADSVAENFRECSDIVTVNRVQLMKNFDALVSVLNINITKLCQSTNYDTSTVFRFRNGSRLPSEPMKFAAGVAGYVSRKADSASEKNIIAELCGCSVDELHDPYMRFTKIRNWLLNGQSKQTDSISDFLTKLNEFDLNEYIKAVHFDELKVPSLPFQLPTSKTYTGLEEMMESQLDFLKSTVLSKSKQPVIMYSDMPIGQMAKDPEFPKKWMLGMAMMLKKGLHLNQIHNLDRSFEDMMLGLEGWIPLYMTGQISPYYLKGVQNNVFLHFLNVSGAAALSGEAISGYQSNGRYYLTKSRDEIVYYTGRANELLKNAQPLMEIYREDNAGELRAFLLADSHTSGKRRNILSSLPIYTMKEETLIRFLNKRVLPERMIDSILDYARLQRQTTEEILKTQTIADEVTRFTKEDFEVSPMTLSLSGMFCEKDILYTYEEYLEHWEQSLDYAERHSNYILTPTSSNVFRNLQISVHEGSWAMVSKNKSPAIHFVIHHPKLRNAIENFIPPLVDQK